jgi:hypothetical protein
MRSFRISNAITSGSFGDWAFSKSLMDEAGESTADNGGFSGGTRQPHFEVSFDIASAVPGSEQMGLQISVSPDRGDGARMSFLRFRDNPDGLSVEFVDYQDAAPFGSATDLADGCNLTAEDGFVSTIVASGLDRSMPHRIGLVMDFREGPRNDIVQVFVDNVLVHTGTSWEDYYRYCTESQPPVDVSRTVDSLLLQARDSGGTATNTAGFGFLIDNLDLESGPAPCLPIPQTGCQPAAAQGAFLLLGNGKLKWRWISSATVATSDFGSPTTTTTYHLCLYDPSGVKTSAVAAGGATCGSRPCWRVVGTRGFNFGNNLAGNTPGSPSELRNLLLRQGGAGQGRIKANRLRGQAANLPTLPLTTPVRVQLQQSSSSVCWEATYTNPFKNDATGFKAKSD